MAKDPAMLWYWGDWYSGTALMTRFLKGCYMDLLHAQFNHGRLSLEEIKICLGADFGQAWPALSKKFKTDEHNLFFNERLEQEKEKRQKFVSSRKNNKSGRKKTYDESYDSSYDSSYGKSYENHTNNHMIHHMENENENRNINDLKGGVGEKQKLLIQEMFSLWKKLNPTYPGDINRDYEPLLRIAKFVSKNNSIELNLINQHSISELLTVWKRVAKFISSHSFFKNYSLDQVDRHIQNILQDLNSNANARTKTSATNAAHGREIAFTQL